MLTTSALKFHALDLAISTISHATPGISHACQPFLTLRSNGKRVPLHPIDGQGADFCKIDSCLKLYIG